MKIYTKTGDTGDTSLFSGGRVRKDHLRVEVYGTVDELNSMLGIARAYYLTTEGQEWLKTIQSHLFHLGADLATPIDAKADWLVRIDAAKIQWLEDTIDQMTDKLPELKHFILPGGTPAAATLHVARTICRRAERLLVAAAEHEDYGQFVLPYLNRLSDWLFTMARWENFQNGEPEDQWKVE